MYVTDGGRIRRMKIHAQNLLFANVNFLSDSKASSASPSCAICAGTVELMETYECVCVCVCICNIYIMLLGERTAVEGGEPRVVTWAIPAYEGLLISLPIISVVHS